MDFRIVFYEKKVHFETVKIKQSFVIMYSKIGVNNSEEIRQCEQIYSTLIQKSNLIHTILKPEA